MIKLRWGILGAANIARQKMVPALHASNYCDLIAVASRDEAKAEAFAKENSIPVAYGSYEQLICDPTIDAVYIPLPNHLHVEWIKKAIAGGKHVLCEKPLSLTTQDVEDLIALRESSGLLIGEAYATLHQPRLYRLKELFDSHKIGQLSSGHGCFYLYNRDPNNVRNAYTQGGGSLWDIGVYPIVVGRWMFGEEPNAVSCFLDIDNELHVDHLATGVLKFPCGAQFSFTCGMRFPTDTHMTFYTDTHRVDLNYAYSGGSGSQAIFEVVEPTKGTSQTFNFDNIDQYRLQCDHFALAVQKQETFVGSLEHTLAQTKVLTALFASAASKQVVEL